MEIKEKVMKMGNVTDVAFKRILQNRVNMETNDDVTKPGVTVALKRLLQQVEYLQEAYHDYMKLLTTPYEEKDNALNQPTKKI